MKWISVKERLPEDGNAVLLVNCGYVYMGRYSDMRGWTYEDGDEAHSITHWMPLPEPPQA